MIPFFTSSRPLLGAVFVALAATSSFAATSSGSTQAPVPGYSDLEAAKAEWRLLSHASHLAPQQHIVMSDGRHLTGSQINYAWVLIDRAEAHPSEAAADIQAVYALLHPVGASDKK